MSIGISYKYLKPFHKRFGNLEINTNPTMYCCTVSLSWVNFRQIYQLRAYPTGNGQNRLFPTTRIESWKLSSVSIFQAILQISKIWYEQTQTRIEMLQVKRNAQGTMQNSKELVEWLKHAKVSQQGNSIPNNVWHYLMSTLNNVSQNNV